MVEKKRVLILTYDAGFGHRSAANAIAEAVKATYADSCEVTVYNPMDDKRAPSILRDTQSDYDSFVRKMPEFYKLNYQLSDAALPTGVIDSALTVALYGVIRNIILKIIPDVVVCTHPFYMAPLNSYLTLTKRSIPYVTVITDLTNVHKVWLTRARMLPSVRPRKPIRKPCPPVWRRKPAPLPASRSIPPLCAKRAAKRPFGPSLAG